ncbi:cell adhesion molecule CEACAM3-like [Misgurnus anguillicaudatus]|uniref:cell adhesion molecule CEACAM3-like n=1 Tax=Misgurnus anguillicaudatus TaxID=75329 RepID=UPI003CCFC969
MGVIGAVNDEVKPVSVMEGESVTLHTDTVIKNDDKIYWRFGETHATSRLVQMIEYKVTYEDSIDGRFRDRLQISDTQTGDLTIKNMRVKYSGLYEAEIDSDTGTSSKRFSVTVKESPRVTDAEASVVKSVSKMEGESVTLHTDVQTQRGDLIQWRFGDKNLLIAKGDMEDNKNAVYDDDNRGFSGRLKLDESGNLIITNIRTSNAGVYNLKISSKETKYKTFTVSVSVIGEAGSSSGAVAGLCIFFLLVIAGIVFGVIWYLRKKQPDGYVTLFEGGNAHLHGADSELQTGAQIEWKFNNRVIMTGEKTEDKEISVTHSDNQEFKDRLKLSDDVGSLIINKISKKDTGLYEVNITNNNKQTSHNKIQVNVIDK